MRWFLSSRISFATQLLSKVLVLGIGIVTGYACNRYWSDNTLIAPLNEKANQLNSKVKELTENLDHLRKTREEKMNQLASAISVFKDSNTRINQLESSLNNSLIRIRQYKQSLIDFKKRCFDLMNEKVKKIQEMMIISNRKMNLIQEMDDFMEQFYLEVLAREKNVKKQKEDLFSTLKK